MTDAVPLGRLGTVAQRLRKEANAHFGRWQTAVTVNFWQLAVRRDGSDRPLLLRIRVLRSLQPTLTEAQFLVDARRIASLVDPGPLTQVGLETRGWFQVVFVTPTPVGASAHPQEVA